jgi:hypothetical protein
MNTYLISDFEEIKAAILAQPSKSNLFYFAIGDKVLIPKTYYKNKEKRLELAEEIKKYLNAENSAPGFYTLYNGTNTKNPTPFITIQKGNPKPEDIKRMPKMDDSPSIALVKENAELKAELAYLKLRFSELENQIADQENDLAEQEEIKEESKPNPWASLAEQLIPVAGQLAAAIATKYLTPQYNGYSGSSEKTVATGNFGPNVTTATQNVQYRRPNNSGNLESNDYSGPINGGYNFETNQENQ